MKKEKLLQKLNITEFVLLIILTCECVVGSSGKWLKIGSLSIRIVLFTIAFIIAIPLYIKNIKVILKNKIILSILVFCVVVCYAFINGFILGNNAGYILADLTSIMFLALVPAYVIVFDTKEKIDKLIKYVSYACIGLALVIIGIHFLIPFINDESLLTLNSILNDMSLGGLFSFGNGIYRIYFKSSVCLILPLLYYFNIVINKTIAWGKTIWPYICMSISFTAIVLTYARSIWLGCLGAAVFFVILKYKNLKRIFIAIIITALCFLIFLSASYVSYGFEGVVRNVVNRVSLSYEYINTEESDYNDFNSQRVIELESEQRREDRVEAAISEKNNNPVLGSGLGLSLGTGGKIEYTYLDYWAKMGIVGLASLLVVFLLPFYYFFKKIRNKMQFDSMIILACAMICLYVSSIYNPFITSPIGLSLYAVFVAAVSFDNIGENGLKNQKVLDEKNIEKQNSYKLHL
ncbi:MAG: O-antigen ligase family protein [Christensenellales bacterium]